MNWRKRKKLRKIAHAHGKSHYYEWRSVIYGLCHLDLYMTYCKEKRSEAWRVLIGKKIESAVSEMCDRTRKERLGFVDYMGITKLKPEWNGLLPTPEDLKNEQTPTEET